MKAAIDQFLEVKKVAIAGASPKQGNFGKGIMNEMIKLNYQVIPVNPNYGEIDGIATAATVKDLPADVENLLMVVNPDLTLKIAKECIGTGIKRVWLHRGAGAGSYSEEAHKILEENGIEVIYGFCPMMFLGGGFHKFHFWLRRNLGKMPEGFSMN